MKKSNVIILLVSVMVLTVLTTAVTFKQMNERAYNGGYNQALSDYFGYTEKHIDIHDTSIETPNAIYTITLKGNK